MASLVAPDVNQFGGGIKKEEVGTRTASYVDYFAKDATQGQATKELTAKRVANYQDVVNSCALP